LFDFEEIFFLRLCRAVAIDGDFQINDVIFDVRTALNFFLIGKFCSTKRRVLLNFLGLTEERLVVLTRVRLDAEADVFAE